MNYGRGSFPLKRKDVTDAGRTGAIVLAGGRGTRMGEGEPKPLRPLASRPLIAHVVERLGGLEPIVVNAPADGSFDVYAHHVVPDRRPGFQGPLAGIEAGLSFIEENYPAVSHALVVPSDTPFLPTDLTDVLARFRSKTEIASASYRGRLHPTIALWPVALLSTLSLWLDEERPRALKAFLEHAGFRRIEFAGSHDASARDPFANVNTPEDLATAQAAFETSGN